MAAWQWLNGAIGPRVLGEFLEMFRASPPAKQPLMAKSRQEDSPLSELLALLRAGEGTWSSVNKGSAGDTPGGWPGLTAMTLDEVMSAQKLGEVFAVGAYQFVPGTLAEVVAKSALRGSEMFEADTQNRLASELILGDWKRPSLTRYLVGDWLDTEGNLSKAQNDLAYEWASMPGSDGRGMYDGDSAGNRSTAELEQVRKILRRTRKKVIANGWCLKEEKPVQKPEGGKADPFERLVVSDEPRYFWQQDNGDQSSRSCFSSAAAMLAELVKPGCLGEGSNQDNAYLATVMRHGDTILASSQVAALAERGITARLVRNASPLLIEQQIERWGGLLLGYIHSGPLVALDNESAGHWCLAYRYDKFSLTIHDPMGHPDVRWGGFLARGPEDGKAVMVPAKEFFKRWELQGPPYRYAPGHGWALVVDGVQR